jgi:hypothetical protein
MLVSSARQVFLSKPPRSGTGQQHGAVIARGSTIDPIVHAESEQGLSVVQVAADRGRHDAEGWISGPDMV